MVATLLVLVLCLFVLTLVAVRRRDGSPYEQRRRREAAWPGGYTGSAGGAFWGASGDGGGGCGDGGGGGSC